MSTKIPIEEVENARQWFELLPSDPLWNSHYRCWICLRYSEYFNVRTSQRTGVSFEEGVLYEKKAKNRKTIKDHEGSIGHQEILTRIKVMYDDHNVYKNVKWEEEERIKVTARVMRTVYTSIKHIGASFNSMKHIVFLQKKHGVDMGTQCISSFAHTKMAASISNLMHQRLIDSLKGNASPLSIIADASTDAGNIHQLAVLFHTLEKDVPVTYLYGLLTLGADQSALAQTEVLVKHLTDDGLFNHIKDNVISFVSDGASVMIGHKKGMAARLKQLFGPKLISHHCQNHRIELVFGHSMDTFNCFNDIEVHVNKLYSFYKRSGKIFGSMSDFLDTEELKHFSLNYIMKIR